MKRKNVRRPDFNVYVPKVRTLAERQAWRKAVLYAGIVGVVDGGSWAIDREALTEAGDS